MEKTFITVSVSVAAPIEHVWKCWVTPEDIMQWNHASVDWHTTKAENDLRVGGSFVSRMEAKDGSFGFDFGGVYTAIENHSLIEYTLADDRTVKITFSTSEETTTITEAFETENTNPVELQRTGWQAILDNFRQYAEAN